LELFPETPEQLMRSRYTAYVLKDIDYIIESTFPNERKFYPKKQLISWANEVTWKGLSIVETVDNQVKFIAYFTAATNQLEEHREWSFFEQENGRWYFKEGREF
jgi:SEC-C motif-containing protein